LDVKRGSDGRKSGRTRPPPSRAPTLSQRPRFPAQGQINLVLALGVRIANADYGRAGGPPD